MKTKHRIKLADAAKLPWDDKSADLCLTSPPYMDARTYDIAAHRGCDEWIEWQIPCIKEMLRVTKGPVFYNVGGVTREHCYWPGCEGLLYRLWKEGVHCYRPIIWHKKGIPGKNSDFVRNDTEYLFCFKQPGPLPYANLDALKIKIKSRVYTFVNHNKHGKRTYQRSVQKDPLSNPGNVGQWDFTHQELEAMPSSLIRILAGSNMGHPLAFEHEAPFPEELVAWVLRGWCPPNGTILDPFAGSGTVAAVAQRLGFNSLNSDLRPKCTKLIRQRLETPWLANKARQPSGKGGLFDAE